MTKTKTAARGKILKLEILARENQLPADPWFKWYCLNTITFMNILKKSFVYSKTKNTQKVWSKDLVYKKVYLVIKSCTMDTV